MANDPDKLARAAEELIKAASSHVDSATLAINRDAVETLKQLSIQTASVKDSVKESVKSLKESQDAKMNSMIQSIANVKEELTSVKGQLVTLNQSITNQTKNQALAWAYDNASVNPFKYYEKPKDSYSYGKEAQSTELVRTILLSFRQDFGCFIGNCSLTHYYNQSNENSAKNEEQFREALSKLMHALTGQKPRIVAKDSNWVIYYS